MVYKALEPLRQKGYLTTYNRANDKIDFSAITVIITTHANVLGQVEALEPRDMFMDAPLLDIANSAYTPTLSLTAHASYLRLFGEGWTVTKHREQIRKLVAEAHAKGIMVRLWGIPNRPKWLRLATSFVRATSFMADALVRSNLTEIGYGRCCWKKA